MGMEEEEEGMGWGEVRPYQLVSGGGERGYRKGAAHRVAVEAGMVGEGGRRTERRLAIEVWKKTQQSIFNSERAHGLIERKAL